MVTTRGEQMLALRHARMAASPPLFRGGFRPFFLAAAVWAALTLLIFLLSLAGAITLPSLMDPIAWHRHEMLFGFVGAAIGGYLLTAIPNWTGRLPVAGWPLAGLVGLWLAGRLGLIWSAQMGVVPAALLDLAFPLLLAAAAAREVYAAKGRNAALVGVLLLLAGASLLDHLEAAGAPVPPGLGSRAAIGLIMLLIGMIAGRIVPSFTRNWLAKKVGPTRIPGQPGAFDHVALMLLAAALLAWIAVPEWMLTGALLCAAAALHLVRLTRWQGYRCWREPMVLVLHLAYAWVPAGLALLAATSFAYAVPVAAGIHALTAGAMATMILAVITRLSLSLTGRDPRAGIATTMIYGLVTLGAALRVGAPLELFDYTSAMRWAALAWGSAFLLYLVAYVPILAGSGASSKAPASPASSPNRGRTTKSGSSISR